MKTRIKIVTQGDNVTYWPQVKRWWGWSAVRVSIDEEFISKTYYNYFAYCLDDAKIALCEHIKANMATKTTVEYIDYP